MIAMIRAFVCLFCLFVFTVLLLPIQWLFCIMNNPAKRHLPVYWHRLAALMIGLRVHESGPSSSTRPVLIVANHVSWLDIIALSVCAPMSFIAKQEVSRWPIFGTLAKLQQTIFVDRANRQATRDKTRQIAGRLIAGDRLVLFAEGTSTSGVHVKPFRSALFGALQEASQNTQNLEVQPVALAYTHLNGMPISFHERPVTAFYGDMTLIESLWLVLKEGAVDVVVNFGEPIAVEPGHDRKQVAKELEKQVKKLRTACFNAR